MRIEISRLEYLFNIPCNYLFLSTTMSGPFGIPLGVLTDSYKACHSVLFPQAVKVLCAFLNGGNIVEY
jgi:hypothetical protein